MQQISQRQNSWRQFTSRDEHGFWCAGEQAQERPTLQEIARKLKTNENVS